MKLQALNFDCREDWLRYRLDWKRISGDESDMSVYLRMMVILAAFAVGAFSDDTNGAVRDPGFHPLPVVIVFVMAAFFAIFGGGLGVVFAGRSAPLARPGLSVPFFTRGHPLQFFYFTGFIFLAAGLGFTARGIRAGFSLDGFLVMGAGLGMLAGCRAVMAVFRRRFASV
ncbi:hypothetical protein HZ994_16030 [Akkermansiaceae bacterium]|nr:hypothetical protein HZ994_16030 [Akkermansiaceae bacterium]